MLTAVWVAVVAAAAAFTVAAGVAVYVMLKAARLMTENSAALVSLREREDLLIERAGATIDRAGEQIAKTEAITASVDEVTASMADVTASMTEMRGRMAALTPAAPSGPDGTRGALTWAAALAYGLTRALGLRWAAQFRFRPRGPGAREAAAGPARRTLANGAKPAALNGPPRAALTGRRRAAVTGRQGKESR